MTYKNPFTYVVFLLFIILLTFNLEVYKSQHFVELAKAFVSGSLSFKTTPHNLSDYVFFQGKFYWPLGPFPAILFMPFVVIFPNFYQGFISFPLSIINFYLLYKIARLLHLDEKRSYLLATFFAFGSIYFPLASLPASWYFAQTVACTLLILAIYEFLTKRRHHLIGILIAAAIATRLTLIISSAFFLYYLFKKPTRLSNILKFTIPIVISISLLGIYNYKRFKNPLEAGYSYQIIPKETASRRSLGLFSPEHIPTNIYYMILSGPQAVINPKTHELKLPLITFDSYGLSLFFLSPILFLIFLANYKKETIKVAGITSLLILIPILMYYGIGQRQVGYRYALDFFPFLYLIIADAAKKLNLKILYVLVLWGVFFSVFFSALYLTGFYPH